MFADLPAKIMAAIKAGFLDPLAAAPEHAFHYLMGLLSNVPIWAWVFLMFGTVANHLWGKWPALVSVFAFGIWVYAKFGG